MISLLQEVLNVEGVDKELKLIRERKLTGIVIVSAMRSTTLRVKKRITE